MINEQNNPYFGYEGALYRMDRANKRLWMLCILLVVLLVGSNIAWLHYERQFQTEVTTIEAEQDGDGNNIVGGGDINYGTESKDNKD